MTLYLDDGDVRLYHGHVLEVLRDLPTRSVDCIVTSPPYYGLRDYGVDGQIGLEPTPADFLDALVHVFRECRRVLADHGTCWINLGDSYASGEVGRRDDGWVPGPAAAKRPPMEGHQKVRVERRVRQATALPPKSLLGMPWRLAFALQDDGWILRRDIIWSKPNPMPESVTDRCTSAHEYVFMFTKRARYWYDADAVREAQSAATVDRWSGSTPSREPGSWTLGPKAARDGKPTRAFDPSFVNPAGRNLRSVWEIATQPTPEAHFATYPEELVRRCILAGCPLEVCRECGKPRERLVERTPMVLDRSERTHPMGRTRTSGTMLSPPTSETLGWSDCGHDNYRRGVTLDPFIGSGTTCKVARDHERHSIGIDLKAEYLAIAAKRLQQLSLLGDAS